MWTRAGRVAACLVTTTAFGLALPDTAGAGPAPRVARTVTTDPVGHVHFEGSVSSSRPRCYNQVPVRIQRHRANGTWALWGSGNTDATGFYSIGGGPDKAGDYRAVAPRIVRGALTCLRAVSSVQHYSG